MTVGQRKEWPSIDYIHTIVFDFDGVFTDNKVYVTQDGQESVCCDRRDGLAIDILRRYRAKHSLDLKYFIVSTERNPVVVARANKIHLDCHHGVGDKLAFIREYMREWRPRERDPFARLVYLGNDVNDLSVLQHAGFSIVPSDAHEQVRNIAGAVLPERGGHAFVRAAIERLLGVDKMMAEEINELIYSR